MAEAAKKPPLRGEAAYRATRDAIAKSNEAACAAAVRRRAEKETEAVTEIARQDKRDALAARKGWES
ncbi:hypothetical protein OJ997_04890 [Solirubrobacter phytolaccae]|uniref:Uncharacterized protein n=1 Tax=Solirubrobacter phytolaccae TaxID=1404360 RepID=A0A9X3N4M1_9ACTN|nr:hypothetical protein [Solirubrobacter phytolaccae]MDA0179623.1 hypothetical protein [Solirubrobacter phytolaccae]